MDFFERQDIARRNTAWLVALFAIAVVFIVLAVYLAVIVIFKFAGATSASPDTTRIALDIWDPQLFVCVAGATVLVVLTGSLYKTFALNSGGESVALALGGMLINPQTTELKQRRLLNVVEEMAIASGTAVPPVYLLDEEGGINAFAAGFEQGDAVIGVTRGCIEYLDRDQLQGVMAHEFSHINNGDMRLNLRLVGWTHGILIVAVIGYYMICSIGRTRYRSSSKKNQGSGMLLILALGAALMAIGYIGVFFGKLIKAAVSRQREFLADASAVQFTRNPEGIAGALTKIGGLSRGTRIEDPHAEELSHMFFGDAMMGRWFNIFSTHPPLSERIHRIDPRFAGVFPPAEPSTNPSPAELRVGPVAAVAAMAGPSEPVRRRHTERLPLGKDQALAAVGVLGEEDLTRAAKILDSIPEPLKQAARDSYGARAVIYALLLDDDATVREAQFTALETRAEKLSFHETQQLAPRVDELADHLRLPLVEIAIPALRSLSRDQYGRFRQNVDALISADDKVDFSEYVLRTVVVGQLDVHYRLRRPAAIRHRTMSAVADDAACVLSILALVGHRDEAKANDAYRAGLQELGLQRTLLPASECTLRALDESIGQLAQTNPTIKRTLLAAYRACVAADGKTTVREAELLRAVAHALGCPMAPLFVEGPLGKMEAAQRG